MRVAHVAFDLDGTLVDSGADLAAAVNHVCTTWGRPLVERAYVARCVGDGAAMLLERTLGPLSDRERADAMAAFLEFYGAHCLDETHLYPGVRDVLSRLLDAGRTLSVVTNKAEGLARQILEGLDIRDVFVDVVGGDTLPTRKPDPAGLCRVAAVAGVALRDTVLVGDSLVDLETARAAGSGFVGVAWGLQPNPWRPRRSVVVEHPSALLRELLAPASTGDLDSKGRTG